MHILLACISVIHGDLYKKLHSRVEQYFVEKGIDKQADWQLHLFSLLVFLAVLGFYFGWVLYGSNLFLTLVFFVFLGLSIGILGSLTHEATHRTFAKEHCLNTLLISFSDLIGKSSYKYQKIHAFHHTYTNIDHADPDIALEPILRLSPFQKHYTWQRFQHLYGWLVYSLAAFYTVYNVFTYYRYFGEARFKDKLIFWLGKLSHIVLFIVIPIILLGWQMALLGYLVFMAVAGFYISIIIQPSHLFTSSEFVEPEFENKINEECISYFQKLALFTTQS